MTYYYVCSHSCYSRNKQHFNILEIKYNYFQGHVKYISSREYFSPILDYIYDKDILILASINCNKGSIKFVNKHFCTCIIRVYYCTYKLSCIIIPHCVSLKRSSANKHKTVMRYEFTVYYLARTYTPTAAIRYQLCTRRLEVTTTSSDYNQDTA